MAGHFLSCIITIWNELPLILVIFTGSRLLPAAQF